MKIIAATGREDIAMVYLAEMREGKLVELVESIQPPLPREKKWVLLVSTMFGCPVGCLMCDAGGHYQGKLTKDEMIEQVDFFVDQRFPGRQVPCEQFKIQFARMGEPALNMAVLDALEQLPLRIHAPGLMPSVSTVAPHGTDAFFDRLIDIKDRLYANGRFQFQFSIHTTDVNLRDKLIPVRKWTFDRMAAYGTRFLRPGDRKITLNFALAKGMPLKSEVLNRYFDPAHYLVKITPVNPTCQAVRNGLASYIDPYQRESCSDVVDHLAAAGYEVIVSIGEVIENQIGSNCGQYVLKYLENHVAIKNGYTYDVEHLRA